MSAVEARATRRGPSVVRIGGDRIWLGTGRDSMDGLSSEVRKRAKASSRGISHDEDRPARIS